MQRHRVLAALLLASVSATIQASSPPNPPKRPAQADSEETPAPLPSARRQPALVTSEIVAEGSPEPVNYDSLEDTEPVIISNNIGTTTHSVAAFMKFPDRKNQWYNARIHYSTTTSPPYFRARGELPAGDSSMMTGDPAIAVNPYTTGFKPERAYIVGSRWRYLSDNNRPNWLTVWHSDNGGSYWSGPYVIDGDDSGRWFYDKASVAVSWHSGTRGTVYVAVVRGDLYGQLPATLRVYRSRDVDPNNSSLMRWELMHEDTAGGNAWSPQIVVDNGTGYVYLLWRDWVTSQISLKRSIDQADNFGAAKSFRAAPYPDDSRPVFLYPLYAQPHLRRICGASSSSSTCVEAVSALAARFNWVSNSIAVVWHGREQGSDNTDVYFNSFSTTSQAWGTTVKRVSSVSTNDQWAPALDYDASGNYLVTYYDRRDDPADVKYNLYATKLTSAGDRITGENDIRVSPVASDPAKYVDLDSSLTRALYSLGEYQDLWNWNGKWYSAHVCIPETGTQGDVCFASIAP
jgi:hypothetical protein